MPFQSPNQQLKLALTIIMKTNATAVNYLCNFNVSVCAFSALTLLAGRQEGHPNYKKTEWWGAGVVICLERGADLHMAQLMPLPLTVSCFSKIQIIIRNNQSTRKLWTAVLSLCTFPVTTNYRISTNDVERTLE